MFGSSLCLSQTMISGIARSSRPYRARQTPSATTRTSARCPPQEPPRGPIHQTTPRAVVNVFANHSLQICHLVSGPSQECGASLRHHPPAGLHPSFRSSGQLAVSARTARSVTVCRSRVALIRSQNHSSLERYGEMFSNSFHPCSLRPSLATGVAVPVVRTSMPVPSLRCLTS